jgi:hypothetical protein
MGKGSTPRPFSVSQEEFGNNFDAIFRKPDPKVKEDVKHEAKLESAKLAGYNIKLILDKEEIDATTLD